MLKRVKISYKSIFFPLIAIYIVLPDYFKIATQNSALVLAFILVGLYLMINMKIKIPNVAFKYCVGYLILLGGAHLVHLELTQTLRVIIEYFLLVTIIVDLIKTKEDFYKLIKCILIVALFEAVMSYIHFFIDFNVFSLLQSGNIPAYSLDSTTQYRINLPRVEGSFGHAITYGIYISICACLSLFMYNNLKEKQYLFFYFSFVFSLILTISRMPIIVFIISQIIYLCSMNLKKTITTVVKVILAGVVTFLLVALINPSLFSNLLNVFGLVGDVFSATGISGLTSYEYDSAFTYRAEMIKVLPQMIANNPLFGIGGNGYMNEDFYFLINNNRQTSIDNEYFHQLLLYGLIGLTGLIWWVFGPLKIGQEIKENDLRIKSFTLYKLLIIFIYGVNIFSVAIMFDYKIFIVFVALCIADAKLRKIEMGLTTREV